MKRIGIALILFGSLVIAGYLHSWMVWRANFITRGPNDYSKAFQAEFDPDVISRFEHLFMAVLVGITAISVGFYLIGLPKKPKPHSLSA